MCLATISRGPRGVLRRSEPLEGIYGRSPSVDPVAVRARVSYLVYLTNRMWFSVVCTLIDNDTRHHSGQNVVDSRGAAE